MLSPPWCCPRFSRSPRLAKNQNSTNKQKIQFRNLSQVFRNKYINILHFYSFYSSTVFLPLSFFSTSTKKIQTKKRSASCLKVLHSSEKKKRSFKEQNIGLRKTINKYAMNAMRTTTSENRHLSSRHFYFYFACVNLLSNLSYLTLSLVFSVLFSILSILYSLLYCYIIKLERHERHKTKNLPCGSRNTSSFWVARSLSLTLLNLKTYIYNC